VFKSFDRFTGVQRYSEYFDEVLEPNSTKVVNFTAPMAIDRRGANHTLGYLIEVYSDATLTERTPITQGLVEAIFCVVPDPNSF
jgi:adenylylsulfate kinase-like enzyme